ncbi:hypothetical protein DSM112329_03468 [Paraconexibacter sp. AEG42_29]|uniref:Tat pathway signal sequence domain protein n=1 Tax=Paraconexibacter sp. AEG42_29 TaxID=2997339 RepID=A0AAU7AXX2_9ACTN
MSSSTDQRRRARLRVGGSTLAALALGAAGVALAATPETPVVATEKAGGAAEGAPDLTRVSLQRASDGRLRAGMSFGADLAPKDLVAKSGPPGSACLRLYTATTPGVLPPDYLICVTADAKGTKLRASILAEQVNKLPKRVGSATVTRPSKRSMVLRFSQSAVGKPAIIRFAAEATKPGCIKASCVDTVPNAPGTKKLTLRLEAPPER